MSYDIIKDSATTFREGLDYIQAQFPFYNKEKLIDEYSNNKYSIQMIEKSVCPILDIKDIIKVILFDCLIGNSDRHHSNWAVVPCIKQVEGGQEVCLKLCPLYDNGSSLCAYINEKDIKLILNDKMRFESLINTKSKSAIGWENERPIRHFEMIKKIKEYYFEDSIKYVKIIKDRINEKNIQKILNKYNDKIINIDMKELLVKYIIERKDRIVDIYEMKDGE